MKFHLSKIEWRNNKLFIEMPPLSILYWMPKIKWMSILKHSIAANGKLEGLFSRWQRDKLSQLSAIEYCGIVNVILDEFVGFNRVKYLSFNFLFIYQSRWYPRISLLQ